MASPTLKFKRGIFSDLPTLAVGEPGFTTDRHQLFVGAPEGNQLVGSGDFWNLNTNTDALGLRLLEGTNNGSNFVELKGPNNVGVSITFTVPGTDGSANQPLVTNGSGTLSFSDLNIGVIDIDGGTDIGANITDSDLFIVDDGGAGTNRKTAASRIKSYVLGSGGGGATFDSIVVGGAVTITSSGIDAGAAGIITANTIDTTVLTLGGVNVTSTAAELNILDGVTATATELNVLDGVTAFLDEDNMASNSATAIPSQQSVKAYVDSSVSGVAVTFALAADTGTAGIVTTGTTLNIEGTTNEIETSVAFNTLTIGLPNSVVVGTELEVPTVETGAIQANDGTAAMTIADSTGKVTTSTDHEVQGTFTAAGNAALQGNVDIGNQTSDTVTVTGRFDSGLIPSSDGVQDLGSSSLAWDEGHINHVDGVSARFTGIATAATYKGGDIELTGGGTFGGNVSITGSLSVGGSITSIDVEDLRIVSPVIELGLQRLDDGSLQPPAEVTTYNSGVVMYYNHVGINSTNAKIAAMFAKVKNGGDMRIGFATDVSVTTVGAGDSVASVNAWAEIEARGLWINDAAGTSAVITYSGAERKLENITVDAGTFT